jgi:PAS domain S-box-containing protein
MTRTGDTAPAGTSPLLDLVFDRAGVGLCLVAPDGTIVRANAEWLRSTGFTHDVLGEDIVALFPETRDMAIALHARVRAGHHVDVPRHAQALHGRETWWEGSIDPVPMDGGTGLLITAREVSAESTAAADVRVDLERRARELEATFDAIADGAILYGPDASILRMNRAAEEILGFTQAEFARLGALAARAAATQVTTPAGEPFPPDQVPTARALRGEIQRGVPLVLHRHGKRRFVSASAAPIRNAQGAVVGAVSTFTDVTEQRNAVRLFEGVTSTTPDFVYFFDRSGRFIYANRRLLEVWGVPLADAVGKTCRELGYEQWHHDMHMREIAQVIATKEPIKGEVPFKAPLTGIFGVYEYIFTPVLGPDGEVELIAGTTRDVTERNQAQEALRASEARLRLALQGARMVAWEFDPATKQVTMSENARELLAVRSGRVHDTSDEGYARIHPDDVEGHRALVEAAIREGGSYVSEYRQVGDGDVFWVEERARAVTDASGRTVRLVGVTQNITERKRAEAALREGEQSHRARLAELQAVLDTVPAAVWIARDPHGDRIDANRFGAELLRRPGGSNMSVTAPPGERPTGFRPMKDGRELSPDQLPIQAAARFGREIRDFELDLAFDDGTLLHLLGNAAPVRDESGAPRGSVGAFIDITDRKRSERALRESDRRKDEFLAVLSHELRNPLAPIRNALYILDRAEPGGQQAHRAKEVANRQVAHLARLVDDLLDVTRIARGKVELRRADRDLVALAQRTAEDHRALMQERGLELVVDLPSEPVRVNGDEVRLGQVLGNLLSNAAKFTPAGGKVTLSVRAQPQQAIIHVRDTGPGIEPELLESIFDPFTQAKQTLARSEGGLGLGLALVKGLVGLHGGEVVARNDGGADFVVTLPLAERGGGAAQDAEGAGRGGATDRHRVLVVDDNHDAADTLADLVRMLGHEARVAYDGPEALRVAREQKPDLVLCDIGLPGMDGYEVARELRRLSPGPLRVVAVSGYAQPEDVARARAVGFDDHLSKPPSPEVLLEVVAASPRRERPAAS